MEAASAVFGIIAFGRALASLLIQYAEDVGSGGEDIAELANEIESTVSHIEQLDNLLKRNHITQGWNEHGVQQARRSCSDCDHVLQQLRKLLVKSGADVPNKVHFTKEDINVSFLRSLIWPTQKKQLKAVKRNLVLVKLNVLIAMSAYKANMSNPAEEKKLSIEKIATVWRSKCTRSVDLFLVTISKGRTTIRTVFVKPNSLEKEKRKDIATHARGVPRPSGRFGTFLRITTTCQEAEDAIGVDPDYKVCKGLEVQREGSAVPIRQIEGRTLAIFTRSITRPGKGA